MTDFSALREFEEIFKLNSLFKDDIVDRARLFILKMAMIREIRTVARRLALEVHLANKLVRNKRL